MPSVKKRRTAHVAGQGTDPGKRRSKIVRRKTIAGPQESTPAVIANSLFALTLKPKSTADIFDSSTQIKDDSEQVMYRDLVLAYNHGAELAGVDKIVYKTSDSSCTAITNVLNLFKKNICPEGFEVNIDLNLNKKTKRSGFHFTMYKESGFPEVWHFFEIKHIVNDLAKKDRKLHDLFIIFLKSFIIHCRIPVWFEHPMSSAQYILSDYMEELNGVIAKGLDEEHLESLGYNSEDILKRQADITVSLKEYATGQAAEYMVKIMEAKQTKPQYLLRSLKKYPPQNKLIRFMKGACLLMKEKVGLVDFSYCDANTYDEIGLTFEEQVTVIWDWKDHYSGTYGRQIEDTANQFGIWPPTLAARITPIGCGGLSIPSLVNSLEWPKKLSSLNELFMDISGRFTKYENDRELI